MKDLIVLLCHLLTTLAKLMGPGGAKAIDADSLFMKQQLLVINRSRQRAPNFTVIVRMLLGFWSLFLAPHHVRRAAVILKPSTLLRFHEALKKRKYQLLYSSRRKSMPGPKGPSEELIAVIVEMKRRNPRFGCPRIAQPSNVLQGRVPDQISGNYNYKMGVARIKKIGESKYKRDLRFMSFAPRNVV